ncbi:MAG TPA: SLC13 family permease [Anaerolineales bacterium]|nr:SLC13 family permease [Anaerolineales bacterium]
MLAGAVLAFLTRCFTPEKAYREVEWKALISIGSMLAVFAAIEQTGTARYLSFLIVQLIGQSLLV